MFFSWHLLNFIEFRKLGSRNVNNVRHYDTSVVDFVLVEPLASSTQKTPANVANVESLHDA